MCGIVGLVGCANTNLIQGMSAALLHRGPDGAGHFVDDQVALAMRRLSVIDVAGSDQPLFNEDRSIVAVFNGEIYNYADLRAHLVSRGHSLRTSGDGEVLVHLYEDYGEESVHLLRGMFAFALWDAKRKRLVAARDRLGIKPLYYSTQGKSLAFASEVKGLLPALNSGDDLDMQAVSLYLALQYVPGEQTMLRGVRKVPPAHLLTWQDGVTAIRRYWDVVLDEGERRLNEHTAAQEFKALLAESVALHRISDVPLGVLLSGGIDSAVITALLASSQTVVKTFTVGFDTAARFGELQQAAIVARHFNTEHHEIRIGASVSAELPRIINFLDEPIADPAAIPTYFICKFASESVKVVLTGEGGDEILGGYPRYGWLRFGEDLRSLVARVPPIAAASGALIRRFGHLRRVSRVGTLLSALPLIDRHLRWVSPMSEGTHQLLLGRRPDIAGWCVTRGYLGSLLDSEAAERAVNDLMYIDFRTWLPDDVLMKTDRMSMASSVEARVPYLDHRLVEFAAALPSFVKVKSLGTKALLRNAFRDVLPPSTLRRRKRAFVVPLGAWLSSELRDFMVDTLRSTKARSRTVLRPEAVSDLLDAHLSGRRDCSRALWTVLTLELWLQSLPNASITSDR